MGGGTQSSVLSPLDSQLFCAASTTGCSSAAKSHRLENRAPSSRSRNSRNADDRDKRGTHSAALRTPCSGALADREKRKRCRSICLFDVEGPEVRRLLWCSGSEMSRDRCRDASPAGGCPAL